MIGRVAALVVLAALAGCEAKNFGPHRIDGITESSIRLRDETVKPILVKVATKKTMLVEDESVKPILVENETVKPILVEDEYVKPILVEDETVKPILLEDETVKPILVEDETVKPILVEDETVKPILVEDETVKPILATEPPKPQPLMSDLTMAALFRTPPPLAPDLSEDDSPQTNRQASARTEGAPIVNFGPHRIGSITQSPFLVEDESVKPILVEDETVKPILVEDETVKPILVEDETVKPILATPPPATDSDRGSEDDSPQTNRQASAMTKAATIQGPACTSSIISVNVEMGSRMSISSPKNVTASDTSFCGWNFQTPAGYSLRLQCQDFFLGEQDSLTVAPYWNGTAVFYSFVGKEAPYIKDDTRVVHVWLHLNGKDYRSHFSCTITSYPAPVKGPACKYPISMVKVPAKGSVSFSSPTTFNATDWFCGWHFETEVGSSLRLQCQSFSLGPDDQVAVWPSDMNGQTLPDKVFNGQDFPSIVPLARFAHFWLRFDAKNYRSHFSCTITSFAPCRCGIVNRSTRIVGGVNTQVNEYPWQVGLVRSNRFVFCGGSLVSDRHVITAAHCVTGETLSSFRLLLSGHTTTTASATELIVDPIQITPHSEYGVGSVVNNDIAIIEIAPLNFTNPKVLARPVCLPDTTETYEGVLATATGWGRTSTSGGHPDILQEAVIPVVNNTVCKSTFGSVITDKMICTANSGGKGICFGDSGGPLIAPDGANYELIGVTSFTTADGCALSQYPSGFARITALQSWIQYHTAGSNTCGR